MANDADARDPMVVVSQPDKTKFGSREEQIERLPR